MLLLTRKAGDAIAIGERVVVRVIGIQGNRVQLGIEAPADVRISAVPAAPAAPAGKPKEK